MMLTKDLSPGAAGDAYAAIFNMLVKEILDLRETLSFYEEELFATTTGLPATVTCPHTCSQSLTAGAR